MLKSHEYFMNEALKEAQKAYNLDEIPVGAVVVKDNQIISRAYNTREQTNKISNHAEIIALQNASNKLGSWKLNDCDIYVTLEPCLMCYGAIKQSRINNIYIALKGNQNKEYSYTNYVKDNSIVEGILQEESYLLMKSFFEEKREQKN